jgi:hypothetical protein
MCVCVCVCVCVRGQVSSMAVSTVFAICVALLGCSAWLAYTVQRRAQQLPAPVAVAAIRTGAH